MKIVAVIGIKGGVGTTSVAAHIAAALLQHGKSVLALDLCPQNHLRFYFGLAWQEMDGIATQLLEGEPWYGVCFKSYAGVYFIPFGDLKGELPKQLLPTIYPDSFNSLAQDIAAIDFAEDSWLIVDCPNNDIDCGWRKQLLAHADLVLNVLNADMLSYAMLGQWQAGGHYRTAEPLESHCKEKFLINRFCPAIMLESDIHDLMQVEYAQHLLPVTVHCDESVREALAYKQTVFDCAHHCQASQDFSLLGSWLISKAAVGWL